MYLILILPLFSAIAYAKLTPEEQTRISALSDFNAIAAYEEAIPSYIQSPNNQAVAFRLLGYQWESVNEVDRAFQAFDKSVRILEELPLSAELVYSLGERSYAIYTRTGDATQYCPDRERALTAARKLDEAEPLVHALVRRAFCFVTPGASQDGLVDLQEAMQLAVDNNLKKSTLAMVANASGNLYRSNQLHDRAYTAYRDAYLLWLADGESHDYFNMLHNMVGEAIQVGRWDAAREHVEQLFEVAAESSEKNDYLFFSYFNEGSLLLAQSDYQAAETAFNNALELQQSTAENHFVSETYLRRAEARVWLGQFSGAQKDLEAFHQIGSRDNARHQLLGRLILALETENTRQVVAIMLELRQREATKRYAFVDANTRLFTREHEENIAHYKASLLEQTLALRELALKRAQDQGSIARQTTINLSLLTALLCGLAIWLYHSMRQHRARAHTDFLTGIATRGRIFEQGFRLCDKMIKRGKPLSIVIFDIDRFKRINDKFGHGAGDRAIRNTVDAAKSTLGKGDSLGRLGGEEFVALLPCGDEASAMAAAEAMRAAVAAAGFLQAGNHPVNFTISLGVACLQPGEDFQGLVNRADEALYRAKESGRDRVETARDDTKAQEEAIGIVGSRRINRQN